MNQIEVTISKFCTYCKHQQPMSRTVSTPKGPCDPDRKGPWLSEGTRVTPDYMRCTSCGYTCTTVRVNIATVKAVDPEALYQAISRGVE
jgi:hypothetical protein